MRLYRKLQTLCKDAGIAATGSTSALAERLRERGIAIDSESIPLTDSTSVVDNADDSSLQQQFEQLKQEIEQGKQERAQWKQPCEQLKQQIDSIERRNLTTRHSNTEMVVDDTSNEAGRSDNGGGGGDVLEVSFIRDSRRGRRMLPMFLVHGQKAPSPLQAVECVIYKMGVTLERFEHGIHMWVSYCRICEDTISKSSVLSSAQFKRAEHAWGHVKQCCLVPKDSDKWYCLLRCFKNCDGSKGKAHCHKFRYVYEDKDKVLERKGLYRRRMKWKVTSDASYEEYKECDDDSRSFSMTEICLFNESHIREVPLKEGRKRNRSGPARRISRARTGGTMVSNGSGVSNSPRIKSSRDP